MEDVKGETRTAAPASATARRIASATVTVVAREGFDGLSVRTVAREAGVAPGTVQHHYGTRTRLLLAAFAHTVQSITERLKTEDLSGSAPAVLSRMARQALPLDAQRRREGIVWVTLSAAAASHPELAAVHADALETLTQAVAAVIATATTDPRPDPGLSSAATAAVLVAVLDGLTLHGVTGNRTPTQMITTMDDAITRLLTTRNERSPGMK